MSFNAEIKKELSGVAVHKRCCEKALLCTFFALLSEEKKGIISLKTENVNIGRKIITLSKKLLDADLLFEIKENQRRNKPIISIKATKEDSDKIKNGLGLKSEKADIFFSNIPPSFTVSECCKKASLLAAFLACGFITNPKKSYHLEIVTHKKKVMENLFEILLELSLEPKMTTRKNKYVIYIKNNEEICDFLGIIGAKRSLFVFHETKVEKEIKNRINRNLNCESANEDKVIKTSLIQIQAIQKLIKSGKINTLSEDLKKTAYLRLDNPDMSLSELANIADFKITKSGLNHRLKKLTQL